MINAVGSVRNWFHDIPPDSTTVKVFAVIPIVGTIFFALKERQYIKGYRDNYVEPADLAKAKENSPLFKKLDKSEEQLIEYKTLSKTMAKWSIVHAVAGIVAVIASSILIVPAAPVLGYGIMGAIMAHQFHQLWLFSSGPILMIEDHVLEFKFLGREGPFGKTA